MWARSSIRTRLALVLAAWVGAAGCSSSSASQPEVTFAAAASLRNVLPALIDEYGRSGGETRIAVTYGASGDLRKQVEGGAPIAGVLFASPAPVDKLVQGGHADPTTRRVVATNRLVLIGPKGGPRLTFATLDQLPGGGYLAVGDPGAVPAGEYAKAYLGKLGAWDALERDRRIVFGADVAAVLAYARRGEVDAAVVYATEARGIPDIVVLDEARGPDAPVARIVAAVTGEGPAAEHARAFLDFLSTERAQEILADGGFGPPAP